MTKAQSSTASKRVIPASVRPDGSLRRERRIRPGFTPPNGEEAKGEVYVPPAMRARMEEGQLRPKEQLMWQQDDGGVLEEARRQVSRSAAASCQRKEWYEKEIDDLYETEFWINAVDKTLSINNSSSSNNNKKKKITKHRRVSSRQDDDDALRQAIVRSGVARFTPQRSHIYTSLIAKLSNGITQLHAQGMDASWILLFDEAWELASIVGEEMRHISHGRILPCYDMLAWRVEPGADRSNAFSPHRDRQPDDVKKSFYADDHFPKYASIWVGLANATPESSCLYCLPVDADAGVDAGYYDGDDEDVSPLDKALAGHKERFQDIRALPVADGDALLFSHRLLHWGSRGIRGAAPRISISFGFSDPSFEKPYLRESSRYRDAPPPFHIRLGLIAAQLISYYQRFDVYSAKLRRCRDLFMREASHFDDEYCRKLMYETASALTLTHRAAETAIEENGNTMTEAQNHDRHDEDERIDNDDAEDELDIAMQTMLDAQTMGYDDFDDDYDDEYEYDTEELKNGNLGIERPRARDDMKNGRISRARMLRVRSPGVVKSIKRRRKRPHWFSINGKARVQFINRSPVGKASMVRGLFFG